MKTSLPHPNFRPVIILSALLLCVAATGSYTRPAKSAIIPAAQPFTFLQPGFTQELIGAGYDPGLWTGVAFAPNGDPLVSDANSHLQLIRFNLSTTINVNGSAIHPFTVLPLSIGKADVDITNHPNGDLYTNWCWSHGGGVVRLNINTGAVISGPFGGGGGGIGIAVDPQTGNLVYATNSGFRFVNPDLTVSGNFASVPPNGVWDGITFDPEGNYLFAADNGGGQIAIIRRDGALVRRISAGIGPDGMAFHATAPKFVLSNRNDGTIVRLDFPNDDYSQPPTLTLFASGGFRGDIAEVGPDGCLYLTQNGTRYSDGTVTGENSLVRICGGFAPPPGVGNPKKSSDPGLPILSSSAISDQKAGSVLFFNLYSSSASQPAAENTRINLTNVSSYETATVHLFFVDGSGCSVADSYLCLTPNQTVSLLASDFDPDISGYVVAVAVNKHGLPASFNCLTGDSYIKLASGHITNLAAEAVAALVPDPAGTDQSVTVTTLNFDGVAYNNLPRALAASSIVSPADSNTTLLVLNRIGGSLLTSAASLDKMFGLLLDDSENPYSFTFSGGCQFRSPLNNQFPRTTPRLGSIIPAGHTGWLKLWTTEDSGILGATINASPNAMTSPHAYTQGHNLHKLTLTNKTTLIVPVFPPGC